MMNRRVFLMGAAAGRCAFGQSRLDKGKKTLEQTIAALGGNRFLAMRNRVEVGRAYSFYRENLTGLSIAKIYTEYVGAPGPGKLGIRERQVFGKKEDSSTLFLDGEGFDVTFRGARPLPDAQMERYFQSTWHNFLYILRQRLKEPGMIFETTGQEVVENQPVDVLEMTDQKNEKLTVWVHSSTHLPVKQRWFRREESTHYKYEEVTRFTKYRDAGGGIMWPMSLQRERDTEKLAEIYDEDVKVNAEFKSDLFTLPHGIKILERPKA